MKEFSLGILYVIALTMIYPYFKEMPVLQHGGGDIGVFSVLCSPFVFWIMQKIEEKNSK